MDSRRQAIFVADAYRGGNVSLGADEELSAFVELESAIVSENDIKLVRQFAT